MSCSNPFVGEDGNETGDLSMDEFCDMIVKMKVASLKYVIVVLQVMLAVCMRRRSCVSAGCYLSLVFWRLQTLNRTP